MKGTVTTTAIENPPVDPYLLGADDFALVADRCLAQWPSMSNDARIRMLAKLRKQEEARQAAIALREERSARCAAYVDALCSLPHPSAPEYRDAWDDMLTKKAAYLELKRRR